METVFQPASRRRVLPRVIIALSLIAASASAGWFARGEADARGRARGGHREVYSEAIAAVGRAAGEAELALAEGDDIDALLIAQRALGGSDALDRVFSTLPDAGPRYHYRRAALYEQFRALDVLRRTYDVLDRPAESARYADLRDLAGRVMLSLDERHGP